MDPMQLTLTLGLAGVAALAAVATFLLVLSRRKADQQRRRAQADLERRALELQHTALLQYANDIILLVDDELRIVQANDRAVASYGYSRQELLTMNEEQLRASSTSILDGHGGLVSTGSGMLFETSHRRRDGSTFPVEISSRRVRLEAQHFNQCIVRDITARKRAEEALRASEENLATTLQSIGDAVIATDDRGRIVRMNPVAERLTGWTLFEARGHSLATVFRTRDFKTHQDVRSPAELVLQGQAAMGVTGDIAIVTKKGLEIPIAESAAPIRDAAAHLTGAVLVFRDVTAQKTAQAALAYQVELLNHISDAVTAFDTSFVVTAWNRAAEGIYGWQAKEMIGEDADVLLKTQYLGGSPEKARVALKTRGTFSGELVQTRKDGSRVDTETTIVGLKDDSGAVTGYVAVSRDISERKRLQARLLLADRMASVGRLAAGVAHEINNPLSFLFSNLEFVIAESKKLVHPEWSPETAPALAEALEGADRVRRIVRDLKTMSRSEEEQRGPVDLVNVLRTSLSIANNEIRHRARLVTEIGEVRPVVANSSRLGQVFVNLLMNAAQAIPVGQADRNQIRVCARNLTDGRVEVEVQDSGAGISAEIQSRIFEPFFTTKPIGEGTGLGLAVCHGIVTSLGGEIQVESEPGKGSLFRVRLPGTQVAAAAPAATEAAPAPHGPHRVLVIDDEPLIGSMVERILSPACRVASVTRAREALVRLEAGEKFDVILCDLMMPEMTGMAFHEALSKAALFDPKRVIFVSGGAFTAPIQEFLDRTANPQIDKPFDAAALRRLVDKVACQPG
jgi:PAS domain S-box-containing protein